MGYVCGLCMGCVVMYGVLLHVALLSNIYISHSASHILIYTILLTHPIPISISI